MREEFEVINELRENSKTYAIWEKRDMWEWGKIKSIFKPLLLPSFQAETVYCYKFSWTMISFMH